MKPLCLLLVALNLFVFAASYCWPQRWADEVCSFAFGLCQYPVALAIGMVASIGLFVIATEFE
jgi:hypothetical protein